MLTCDFLVIGSGIAGLSFALEAAEHGDVIVVTKRAREESNTKYAQGGIAAVLDKDDSFEKHVADTLVAGAGMTDARAAELCVREAPGRIRMLQSYGARFDRSQGVAHADESSPDLPSAEAPDLDLHLEGGHSARRIVHTGDMTGREVERALVEAVTSAKDSPAMPLPMTRKSHVNMGPPILVNSRRPWPRQSNTASFTHPR
jgi:L-aspartate oxidase